MTFRTLRVQSNMEYLLFVMCAVLVVAASKREKPIQLLRTMATAGMIREHQLEDRKSAAVYSDLGEGHCVDIKNRRPFHCWGVTTKEKCEQHCTSDAQCVAYEYGQDYNGILCQLIYLNEPDCGPYAGLKKGAGDGGNSVSQAFHQIGGRCYKKQANSMWPEEKTNKYCKNSIYDGKNYGQIACQKLCEAEAGCVGIAHSPLAGSVCHLCQDDILSNANNHYGFYRNPGCTSTDAGHTDRLGNTCDDYNRNNCGGDDDDDFQSNDMCCFCGGGAINVNIHFVKRENSFCHKDNAIAEYTTLSEAQSKCLQNPLCTSVYDYKCDDEQFWTCSGIVKPSSSGSCTWTMKHKDICLFQDGAISGVDVKVGVTYTEQECASLVKRMKPDALGASYGSSYGHDCSAKYGSDVYVTEYTHRYCFFVTYFVQLGTELCTGAEIIDTLEECSVAIGLLDLSFKATESANLYPKGCYRDTGTKDVYWNIHSSGRESEGEKGWGQAICKTASYELVHGGHCAAGWDTGPNTNHATIIGCRNECASRLNVGYFAYRQGNNCACYFLTDGCPDDNQNDDHNAYRILRPT